MIRGGRWVRGLLNAPVHNGHAVREVCEGAHTSVHARPCTLHPPGRKGVKPLWGTGRRLQGSREASHTCDHTQPFTQHAVHLHGGIIHTLCCFSKMDPLWQPF